MRAWILLLAFLVTGAARVQQARAQVLQGQVVEDGTNRPLRGTFVILLDSAGIRRGAALTGSDGRFTIKAPAAGEYRLRAERIGFAATTSPALAAVVGRATDYQFVVPIEPIELEGLRASGENRCHIPRDIGDATHALWEEARKALSVAEWLGMDPAVAYQTLLQRQTRDLVTLDVMETETWLESGYGKSPFDSESAGRLAELGYVRALPDGTYQYFGLDAPTLLSDDFIDTHCFRIRESKDGDGQDLIGLAFEPTPSHHEPDIEGVLWLDKATDELRHVDFEFTRHPYPIPVPPDRFGGRVDFRRLDNGAWVVDRWWIRMPQLVGGGQVRGGVRFKTPGEGRVDQLLEARRHGMRVREKVGELRFMAQPGPIGRGNAVLEGVVWDSARSVPLAGARVFLQDAHRSALTSADGRFRMSALPSQSDEVGFIHPHADSLGLPVVLTPVQLLGNGVSRVDLFLPRASGCSSQSNLRHGAVVGFVRNKRGDPVGGIRVTAEWKAAGTFRPGAGGVSRRVTSTSDERGHFILCGLPVGPDVRVAARHDGDQSSVELHMSNPGLVQQDLVLR